MVVKETVILLCLLQLTLVRESDVVVLISNCSSLCATELGL
jgi:hypothetical protein